MQEAKFLAEKTLAALDAAFEVLERKVPPPQMVLRKRGFVFRYKERSIQQAIILKLARVVSGLRAAFLLLENGHVQEQAAMQRLVDEYQEDVVFLAYALTLDELTPLHQQYLDAFFEEEFNDDDDPFTSKQLRPMMPRKKIRKYITKFGVPAQALEALNENLRTIYKTYSGYVHAAAPQIMELYGGDPPKFHLAGMLGTPRINEHQADIWNYFFRALTAFCIAAYALQDAQLAERLRRDILVFESASGVNS